jgi:integrase
MCAAPRAVRKQHTQAPIGFAPSCLPPNGAVRSLPRDVPSCWRAPEAEIGFKVHPHMLRHAAATRWANKGLDTPTLQAYLGHRSIDSTTRYAALAPGRFKNIWGRA